MLFTSPLFLFGFLPLFLLGYFAAPRGFRNVSLLLFSLLFYAWGEPKFVFFVLISSWLDWLLAGIIASSTNRPLRRAVVGVAVVGNIGMLIYFKYFNFFLGNINAASQHWFGSAWVQPWPILLPLAISFIAFEKITYVVDIYRGIAKPAESFLFYLVYVFFFPKLIAGPIIKYHDISGQLASRRESLEDMRVGFFRITRGIAKKVLLANGLGIAADNIFAASPDGLTAAQAWFGAFAFGFELYFDFSGYSDIAIGLARIMGIRVAENFNLPYQAASFTEFWQRWHISLTGWIREYLYFPLGGNRRGAARTYLNLWICFLVSGLWHGANWTFVAWGVYHGTMLVIERLGGLKLKEKLPRPVNIGLTFVLVTLGWVVFRAGTLTDAAGYLRAMFSPGRPCHFVTDFDPHLVFIFVASWLVCFLGLLPSLDAGGAWVQRWGRSLTAQAAIWTLLLMLAVGEMYASQIKTFLYFRF
jgi:alginate O-acetyltransferase complex protein AlgI